MSARWVVRVPGRRLFLRWRGAETFVGLVERSDGTGGVGEVTTQEGPALGGPHQTFATREKAEALLARCKAHGGLADLVGRCVVEAIETGFAAFDEAPSRPPRLSDWVRAVDDVCGDGVSWDTDGEYLCGFLPGHYVSIHSSGSEGAVLDDEHFDTPSELRAALERLAEAKVTP